MRVEGLKRNDYDCRLPQSALPQAFIGARDMLNIQGTPQRLCNGLTRSVANRWSRIVRDKLDAIARGGRRRKCRTASRQIGHVLGDSVYRTANGREWTRMNANEREWFASIRVHSRFAFQCVRTYVTMLIPRGYDTRSEYSLKYSCSSPSRSQPSPMSLLWHNNAINRSWSSKKPQK